MFQRHDHGFGHGGGAAILTLDAVIPQVAIPTGFVDKLRVQLSELDLVVDLGARIGSPEWWRGLATCAALCGSAVMLSPGFEPLKGIETPPLTEAQWDEARTIAIAPIAFGSDTGRRMAPTESVVPLVDTPERPSIDLTATLGQGDGFARVLERAGVAREEARKVADLVSGAVPVGDIKSGTRIALTLGRRPNKQVARPLDALEFRARFELSLAVERIDGTLRLRRIPIAVDNTPLRVQGVRGSDLLSAARSSGVPGRLAQTFLQAIRNHVSIGSLKPSDRFDMVIEHRRAATGEVEVGQLLYAGLVQGKRQTRLLKWKQDGREQWFEASGVGEKRGTMQAPVLGRLTSGFGMRRHPLLGYSRFHKGIDFGAAYGSPIVAANDGTVSFAGWHGGHGKYVMIRHGGGMATAYAHMSRIVAQAGHRVRQGQVIGYVGSTGLSTGPHLHYEIYRNGVAINPRSVSFITTSQLAGTELARFRARLSQLLAIRPGAPRGTAPASAATASAEAKAPAKPRA